MRNGIRKFAGTVNDATGKGQGRQSVSVQNKFEVQAAVDETETAPVADSETQSGIGAPAYSDSAIAELFYMLEEEKLAGDLYEAFYVQTGSAIFRNIASAEDKHFESLAKQADKMGIDTEAFEFLPEGEFVNEEVQALYDELLAAGTQSRTEALKVGVFIEETDIIDLKAAVEQVPDTPLADVYERLLDGSESHLAAFEAQLL